MSYKLRYKFDAQAACRKILKDQLAALEIPYAQLGSGEIEFKRKLSNEQFDVLNQKLLAYGIQLLSSGKRSAVQEIKDAIYDMVHESGDTPSVTTSVYLEKKLNKSYSSISKIFKEATYSSIENYIILQKVERAKELIIEDKFTLTEISFMLNYSSVAHLSSQFKKVTGLTASSFARIIKERRKQGTLSSL